MRNLLGMSAAEHLLTYHKGFSLQKPPRHYRPSCERSGGFTRATCGPRGKGGALSSLSSTAGSEASLPGEHWSGLGNFCLSEPLCQKLLSVSEKAEFVRLT